MYIPYEIWDKVYYFSPESNKLIKWTILEFRISKEFQKIITDQWIESSFEIDMLRCYPSKAVVKEELLQRAVNYANESLIDL